jgi:dienelactone hydrolase
LPRETVWSIRRVEIGEPKRKFHDIFKNASHAFFADYRPSYREPAAFELWPKMVSFFKTLLK